jgi:glucose-6-phosphate 1-dehydrogenase
VIGRLVVFGASGDLTGRFLLPALAALHADGELPASFQVVGAATENWGDYAFRHFASEHLDRHAAEMPARAREALVRSLRYRRVDVTDADSVAEIVRMDPSADSDEPLVAYLALPQSLFAPTVTALASAGLPQGSRVGLEKPFGESLADAVELNALLARVAGPAGEQAIFRVDHVLGMATVQNLIALRSADPVLGALWSSEHVDEIEVLWEETLALEGRAGFYDRAGALKDVVQNHLMQILSLVAMEPPAGAGERQLRDRKLGALRAVRPLAAEQLAHRTRRARYTAGRLSGTGGAEDRPVPAYLDENGVDARRDTETFVELLLELETPRWAGTRFRLRAGKALAQRRKGVVVHFRPVGDGPAIDELRIGLDGPENLSLRLTGRSSHAQGEFGALELASPPYRTRLPAYGRVLLDLLTGAGGSSVGGEEAEEAWRIVTPVMEAWADGQVPMDDYPAGSAGPRRLDCP